MKLFLGLFALLAAASCIAGHIYDARGFHLSTLLREKPGDESSTAMPLSSADSVLRLRRHVCVGHSQLGGSTPTCRSWCKKHPQSIDCLAVLCECEKLAIFGDDYY